jgi:hypothetical protein
MNSFIGTLRGIMVGWWWIGAIGLIAASLICLAGEPLKGMTIDQTRQQIILFALVIIALKPRDLNPWRKVSA